MKKYFRYIAIYSLLSLCIVFISFGQLQNNNSNGGLAGASMQIGFGARGIGMGNALTAVNDGEIQAYYNPALTPFASVPTITAAYSMLSLDRRLNYLSYTNHIKPSAGISVSIINAGVGDIDGRNYDGVHTETYSTSENSFMLSFGLKTSPRFAVGITAKILYYSLFEEVKSTTAAFDIGAIYLLPQNINIGLVIQDIGSKYKWDTSKLLGLSGNVSTERFPLRKRIGLSWLPSNYPFIVSSEFEAIGSATFFRFGSEIELNSYIHLRCGIDQIALNTDEPAKPSIGFSVEKKFAGWTPSFQYAYIFEPYSPSGIHIISLSLKLE